MIDAAWTIALLAFAALFVWLAVRCVQRVRYEWRTQLCHICFGSGVSTKGRVADMNSEDFFDIRGVHYPCPACNATGRVYIAKIEPELL